MEQALPELPCPPLPRLPVRPMDSHKGLFGHALLIGGSRGMAGAISLSGLAALRAGAGLVTLAVPDRCLETVAAFNPCAMTIPLPDSNIGVLSSAALPIIESWYDRATCIAIGPGLGRSPELSRLVCEIYFQAPCPVVIDADGLNNLAERGHWRQPCRGLRILTPHPGEWSRLCGCPANDKQEQRRKAIGAAKELGVIIVLKGQHSLITDGLSLVLNATGTPAMATAGSGDVLTGVIAAMVCQGLTPREAAHLGVYLHGLSGQMAQRAQRSHVVIATELVEHLSQAIEESHLHEDSGR